MPTICYTAQPLLVPLPLVDLPSARLAEPLPVDPSLSSSLLATHALPVLIMPLPAPLSRLALFVLLVTS